MRLPITFLLILFSILSLAQEGQPYTILSQHGLNFRSKPSIASEAIRSVPFGAVVMVHDLDSKLDTINGIGGYWSKSKYDNVEGYLFSPYLFRGHVLDIKSDRFNLEFYEEGAFHRKKIRNPLSDNWYGIYEDSSKVYVERVSVEFVSSKLIDPSFHDYCAINDIYLKTNRTEKSKFLVATEKVLIEGGLFFEKIKYKKIPNSGFIYPEMVITFSLDNRKYNFRGYEEMNCQDGHFSRVYGLELVDNPCWGLEHDCLEEEERYELSDKLIHSMYSARRHSSYNSPALMWVADIDSDGNLEFMVRHSTMVDHGGNTTTQHFFTTQISGMDELEIVLNSYITWEGCY